MPLLNDINMTLRDFEVVNTAHPAPIGDPASGRHNIMLPELRELLKTIAQSMGDPDALQEILTDLAGKADQTALADTILNGGKVYSSRAAAVAAGQARLPWTYGRIVTIEGTAWVVRSPTHTADALFATEPYWGVVLRMDVQGEVDERRSLIDEQSGALVVTDDVGFVILRASPTELKYMGQDLRPGGDAVRQPDQPTWRRARAAALQGREQARILCLGDSNTIGWNGGGGGVHVRAYAYPSMLVRGDSNFSDASVIGRAGIPSWATFDPRVSLGAGWTAGPVSAGGETWENSTTTNAIAFTPEQSWRTARVYFACAAPAQVSINAGTGPVSYSLAGSSIEEIVIAGTEAIKAVSIARVSGTVRLIGWICESDIRRIDVLTAGRTGWQSAYWADTESFAAPLPAAAALSPDITLIQLGLNDFNLNIDPAVFAVNMRSIVAAMKAVGDVALIVPMPPGIARTYPWQSYVDATHQIAADEGLRLVDLSARFGSYASALAQGFVNDAMHLSYAGYGDAGYAIRELIKE